MTHAELVESAGRARISRCRAVLRPMHTYLRLTGSLRTIPVETLVCPRCDQFFEVAMQVVCGPFPFRSSLRHRKGRRG